MSDMIKRLVSSKQGISQVIRDLEAMLDEHGFLNVEIKRGHRTLSQNALYWMWMREIADFINIRKGTDFSADEIHTKMKVDFLGFDDAKMIGSTHVPQQIKSTKKLTKSEMFVFMQQIEAWAAGVGLHLTRPDDSQYDQLKKQNA